MASEDLTLYTQVRKRMTCVRMEMRLAQGPGYRVRWRYCTNKRGTATEQHSLVEIEARESRREACREAEQQINFFGLVFLQLDGVLAVVGNDSGSGHV